RGLHLVDFRPVCSQIEVGVQVIEVAERVLGVTNQRGNVIQRTFGFVVACEIRLRVFQRGQLGVQLDRQRRLVGVVLGLQLGLPGLYGVLIGQNQLTGKL